MDLSVQKIGLPIGDAKAILFRLMIRAGCSVRGIDRGGWAGLLVFL